MEESQTDLTTQAGYLTKLIAEMEARLGCGIEVVEDRGSRYPSKIEYARNYARDHHVLRVNPTKCRNAYPVFFVLLNTKLQLREMSDGSVGILQPVSGPDEDARFNDDFKADPVGRTILGRYGSEADSIVSMLRGGLITQSCNQVLEMLAVTAHR